MILINTQLLMILPSWTALATQLGTRFHCWNVLYTKANLLNVRKIFISLFSSFILCSYVFNIIFVNLVHHLMYPNIFIYPHFFIDKSPLMIESTLSSFYLRIINLFYNLNIIFKLPQINEYQFIYTFSNLFIFDLFSFFLVIYLPIKFVFNISYNLITCLYGKQCCELC